MGLGLANQWKSRLLCRLPGSLPHLLGGRGHAGGAVAECTQLRRTVDQPLGHNVDDQPLAFY